MDPLQRTKKFERSTSLDQQKRREEMKKRLESSKMGQTLGNREETTHNLMKSARLLNAFDSTEAYPDNRFTANFAVPSVPQTIAMTPNQKSSSLTRIKSETVYQQNNVRRKKDELVKTLLLNNRNR